MKSQRDRHSLKKIFVTVAATTLLTVAVLTLISCGKDTAGDLTTRAETEMSDTQPESEPPTQPQSDLPVYGGNKQLTLPAPDADAGKLTVVIDAGHGQKDVGTLEEYGGKTVYEANVNLAAALRLEYFLTRMGYRVVMIRRDDTALLGVNGDEYTTTQEAEARRQLAENISADLYISLHCNSASSTDARGTRVYYRTTPAFSGAGIAVCFQTALNTLFSKDIASGKVCTVKDNYLNGMTDPYIVLKSKTMPALLFEMGFFTNDQDMALLQNSDFLWEYAYALACGTDDARRAGLLD